MDWCKEFIDFGFAVLATGLGVLGAFELDRWRYRRESRAKKLKLIEALIVELDFIVNFTKENPSLRMYTEIHLQTDVIEETVKDQLDFFDHKTNNHLKTVRKFLIIEKEQLADWAELNKSALGTGKYENQIAANNASSIMNGWTTFCTNISASIAALKKELEKEKGQ